MFTGIIEEVGSLKGITGGADKCVVRIGAQNVLEGTRIGDSIAVNGVCLTVVRMGRDFFEADLSRETVDRTSLRGLSLGAPLNLERALRLEDRLGGHIVTGHIDGTGTILQIENCGNSYVYRIGADEQIIIEMVEKGSVAVEGVSLTISAMSDSFFEISVIPHTRAVTNLSGKKRGDTVNLECDIIGKYVMRYLNAGLSTPFRRRESAKAASGVTEAFLAENGFL